MEKLEIFEKKVHVNGIDLAYFTCGEGPDLILLHGGVFTAEFQWNDYLPKLVKFFKVYAIDTRGHGKSVNPEGIWSIKQFAEDLEAFINKLELDQPYVCGWSDGGQIALEHAVKNPGKVPKYLIAGASRAFYPESLESLEMLGISKNGEVDFEKFESVAPEFALAIKRAHSCQGEDYWKEAMSLFAKECTKPFEYTDEDLRKIVADVLLVIGDRDEYNSLEQIISMYKVIDKSYLCVMSNTNHSLMATQRKWLTSEIIRFFIDD